MIPDLVRVFAKQLALGFVLRARRQGMTADEVHQLEVWAMARLAENDYELLRTTKLSDASMLIERLYGESLTSRLMRIRATIRHAEHALSVRVRCLDVEVGRARFDRAVGLAYTALEPSSEYPMIAPFARAIGEWLAVRRHWTPVDRDVADIVGERWLGGRLALEDHIGRELAVSHVIVVERKLAPYGAPLIQLVADFRTDHARFAALVPTGGWGSGGRRGMSA